MNLKTLKKKKIKLVLMVLALEISLARIFAGSWIWAVLIVLLYCTFVYIRQTLITKSRNKSGIGNDFTMIEGRINSNSKMRKQLNNIYESMDLM